MTTLARTSIGIARGLSSLAMGGGIAGVGGAFDREIQRYVRSNGGLFGSLVGNAIGSRMVAGAARAARTAEIADVAAASRGGGGAVETAAGSAAGGAAAGGIWSAMPLPVKIVSIAASALGAGAYALDKFTEDVTGRSRTARGVGASMGGFTSFDIAAQRYVEPKSFMSMMAEAKFDIQSESYKAMSLLGIDPKKYSDTSEMAKDALPRIQNCLQQFKGDEEAMLPMARAVGLGGWVKIV
jgi:hypothetical protein